MTEQEISGILKQIENGLQDRNTIYICCGQSFPSLFEFRKHLFEAHLEEYKSHFKAVMHREKPVLPTKEEIHKIVNKRRKIKDKQLTEKERRIRAQNRSAYATPAKGDHFRIIYTPMGNKK